MRLGNGVHLFYCLNVYPSNTLSQLDDAAFNQAGSVLRGSGISDEYALGMWLRNSILSEFDAQDFRGRLQNENLYCVSLNGFPFGDFHGTRIKEQVYQPDYSTPQRVEYTKALARTFSKLLPDGETGTISTLPIGYRSALGNNTLELVIRNLQECAQFLHQLYLDTGKKIQLALEPEPDCFLDSSAEAAEWLDEILLKDDETCREYIGVCLDTVHSGVLFEKPVESLNNFTRRGVGVFKIQLGGAIEFDAPDGLEAISEFCDEVYLHQTRVKSNGRILNYPDLPEALRDAPSGKWRVHYHVPLCWQGSGALGNSAKDIDEHFISQAIKSGVKHFEVEIYTLDLFPDRALSTEEVFRNDLKLVHSMLSDALKVV